MTKDTRKKTAHALARARLNSDGQKRRGAPHDPAADRRHDPPMNGSKHDRP
jgi:hypothetical protein